eukprot:4835342-Prymnesium_polylepis.1
MGNEELVVHQSEAPCPGGRGGRANEGGNGGDGLEAQRMPRTWPRTPAVSRTSYPTWAHELISQ